MTFQESETFLPNLFIKSFWQAASQEMGVYSLNMILLNAGLLKFVEEEGMIPKFGQVSDNEFSHFQRAMREYFGRGARGILTRTGRGTWKIMVHNLPRRQAILLGFVHYLPFSYRTWLVLNQLRLLLTCQGSWTQVTREGKDLYYLDCLGLGIGEQNVGEPACWTMLGLIEGAMESVTHRAFDVEEVACRGAGSEACKFRVHFIA
jgi:hypothetical protein